MPLLDLESRGVQFIIFGGKGGAGKTACAAATGMWMASRGRKTLVFSVDPAHSLSDIFQERIGNKITPINGIDKLSAIEMDAKQLLDELKLQYKETITQALSQILRGVDLPFEREVAESVMDLSPPGLDELMALSKLASILRADSYEVVVVDTAAGAHAIRLIQLPTVMEEWLAKALHVQQRLQEIMPLEGSRTLLENLRKDVGEIRRILTNSAKTRFVIVTIPEAMGTYVTEDFVESLKSCGIPCEHIAINYVIPSGLECQHCGQRRTEQLKRVRELREKFPDYEIVEVPLLQNEVRGQASLTTFAEFLFEGPHPSVPLPTQTGLGATLAAELVNTPRLDLGSEGRHLILFGGKGGCGKTTCAAATGIRMAKQGRKTLILSTDPQRSLSDSFDLAIGDEITPIREIDNLYAVEVDAEKLLREFRAEHGEGILDIVADATYLERGDLKEFLGLSLPGMDEVMALIRLTGLMEEGEYEVFVLDTAPTGHTLRFLELPDKMSDWVKLMLKMRSKTQYIVQRFFGRGLREKADVFLEKMLSDVKRVKSALKDRTTEFVPVTTLDKMALEETYRLVSTLRSIQIPVRQLICNSIVPRNPRCSYCRPRNVMQEKSFSELRQRFETSQIVAMPLFPYEIRGIERLTTFETALFEGGIAMDPFSSKRIQ